jgi:internalin A
MTLQSGIRTGFFGLMVAIEGLSMQTKSWLFLLSLVAIAVLPVLTGCGNDEPTRTSDFEVTFADPNLEAVIREALGIDTGAIYYSELQQIEELHADNRGITDISGIGNCEQLRILSLDQNQIASVTPLRGLSRLNDLSCSNNLIDDISIFSSLINLRNVNLDSNQITDISYLPNIDKMISLHLSGNGISDINILSRCQSLEVLYLDHNQVENISALTALSSVRLIDVRNNQITDISPLVDNDDLGTGDEVRLTGNPLSGQSIDEYIPALEARGVKVIYQKNTALI